MDFIVRRFLQVVMGLLGSATLAFLVWEPQVEGRNANATQFEIYFQDPFLLFVYASSIPFFVIVYQMIRLLGVNPLHGLYKEFAAHRLMTIRRCAIIMVAAVLVSLAFMPAADPDDRPAGIMLRAVALSISAAIAFSAWLWQCRLAKFGAYSGE